jgi:hypothetical protein
VQGISIVTYHPLTMKANWELKRRWVGSRVSDSDTACHFRAREEWKATRTAEGNIEGQFAVRMANVETDHRQYANGVRRKGERYEPSVGHDKQPGK